MTSLVNKDKKVRVSYFTSQAMHSDLKDNMIRNGYDLKGKSKWVSEAIYDLLMLQKFSELVFINDQMQGFEKLDSLLIDKELKIKLAEAVINVRTFYPGLDGVQSKIVRTAIMQRLLR
jgi:hypothetical protein